MKKIIKIVITVFTLFIFLLLQKYFLDKPKQKFDDIQIQKTQKVKLVRVVDGDTLVLNIHGENKKIRLIGMNSPESVKPHSPIECFGKEASVHAKEILKNKNLSFTPDSSQGTRDRFGRLLAYVFMNGKNFAEMMIADGYAYEYTYDKKYLYQSDFKKAEREARINERGLWSPDTCKGKK